MAGIDSKSKGLHFPNDNQSATQRRTELIVGHSVEGVGSFARGAKIAVNATGRLLVVADADYVNLYQIELDQSVIRPVLIGKWKTGFTVAGAASAGEFLLAASDGRLFDLDPQEGLVPCAKVCGRIISLGRSAGFIIVSLTDRLIAIEANSKREALVEEFSQPFRVKTRSDTDNIVVIEQSRRHVHTINLARACRSEQRPTTSIPIDRVPINDHEDRPKNHRKSCCCCRCKPPQAGDGRNDDRPRPAPQPPRRPPDRDCRPGGGGDVEGCIALYARGDRLYRINRCDPNERPCIALMPWQIGEVDIVQKLAIVVSLSGRRMAVVSIETMRVMVEEPLDLDVEFEPFVSAIAAPIGFAVASDGSSLAALVLASLAAEQNAAQAALSFSSDTASLTYHGSSSLLSFDNQGPQTGTRQALVVPILMSGQTYDRTDLTEWKEWATSSLLLGKVRDYYTECSGGLFDVEFRIFGIDTPEVYNGPPLSMTESFEPYYNDEWRPAGLWTVISIAEAATLTFSGDESVELEVLPFERAEKTFNVRFFAASARYRIPNNNTIDFDPTSATPRKFELEGFDQNGAHFVKTYVYSGSLPPDSVPMSDPSAGAAQIASLINAMIDEATPAGQDPTFVAEAFWQDDGELNGMLHIGFRFSGSGPQQPFVTNLEASNLLPELKRPFENVTGAADMEPIALPVGSWLDVQRTGGSNNLTYLIQRVIADAIINHADFQSIKRPYFEFGESTSATSARAEGSNLVFRFRFQLSTDDGRTKTVGGQKRARISLGPSGHVGLDKIGMNAVSPVDGVSFPWKKRNSLVKSEAVVSSVYTAMVHAAADYAINATNGIRRIYRSIHGLDLTPTGVVELSAEDIEEQGGIPSVFIFAMVDDGPEILSVKAWNSNPPEYLERIRGADRDDVAKVLSPNGDRVLPIGSERHKIIMPFLTDRSETSATPGRTEDTADTVAHELGHGLLGLSDLYKEETHRQGLLYMGQRDLMDSEAGWPHLCLYHQLIKGWIQRDSLLIADRPTGQAEFNARLIIVELERWNRTWSDADIQAIRTALSDGNPVGPVVAGVMLRLGGDGHLFDTIELRRKTNRFSQFFATPRLVIANAYSYDDDTRYFENEEDEDLDPDAVDAAAKAIMRFRRKIHLIDDSLPKSTGPDVFEFINAPKLVEKGLSVELEDLQFVLVSGQTVAAARIRIEWEREPSIDLGFAESERSWQSPDIGIDAPPFDIPLDTGYPEGQPLDQGDPLKRSADADIDHHVFVRVHNRGTIPAENVQVFLERFEPGDGGDLGSPVQSWDQTFDQQIDGDDFRTMPFIWTVRPETAEHSCLKARIGDRDVGTDGNEPLGSDDTNEINIIAQQNVFDLPVGYESPPEPIEFFYAVSNVGSVEETAAIVPVGLPDGVSVTISPVRFEVPAGGSRYTRIRIEMDEKRPELICGKDFTFRLETRRIEAESVERWGACEYRVKLRKKTRTLLEGGWSGGTLIVHGAVAPDVGFGFVKLHIVGPNDIDQWQTIALGPGASYQFETFLVGSAGDKLSIIAFYEGSSEFAASSTHRVVTYTAAG